MSPGRRKTLWGVVERVLTPCQRRALLGVTVEGKSCSQLARELGVRPSSVLRAARRGRERLRRALALLDYDAGRCYNGDKKPPAGGRAGG
mgnify:CR=1 FL=1